MPTLFACIETLPHQPRNRPQYLEPWTHRASFEVEISEQDADALSDTDYARKTFRHDTHDFDEVAGFCPECCAPIAHRCPGPRQWLCLDEVTPLARSIQVLEPMAWMTQAVADMHGITNPEQVRLVYGLAP